MDNSTVTIPAREYEQLARDSEKVRILTQTVLDEVDMGDYFFKSSFRNTGGRVDGKFIRN